MINKINDEDNFIKMDYYLLSKYNKVYLLKDKPTIRNPINFVKQLIKYYKLIKLEDIDLIYSWWCDNYFSTILSIITRKKLIYVAGGYDVACVPKLKYGAACNPFKKKVILFCLQNSDSILAVSDVVKKSIQSNFKINSNKIKVIHLDFDSGFWINKKESRKYILTVAINENNKYFEQRHNIKGVDRFIELARKCPNFEFLLVGYDKKLKQRIFIPDNLKLIKKIDNNKLLEVYNQSKIYCQFSRIESFGSALAESMLCGCIPVGTDAGNIPEVIENSGVIFDKVINEDIIYKIMTNKITFENPRNLIISKYINKREVKLIKLLNKIKIN